MNNLKILHNRRGKPLDDALVALSEIIARWAIKPELYETAFPALKLRRYDAPTEVTSFMYEPSICLVAQGAKRVFLGEERYVYDARHYLLTSVGMPVLAQVIEASEEKPFLGLVLTLDPRAITQLMVDSNLPAPRTKQASRGMAIGEVTPPLLSGLTRLIDLLDEPEDIPILAPLIHREIIYRLLVGDQGQRLRQIASSGTHSQQIAQAINWLRENYASQVRIDDLAAQARMGTSTFHHHFRALTAMSPLQFQKKLRLHEARQLMLAERMDASTAAFLVGYESPSQFSREYNRLFGAPPLRDIKNLRRPASVESV